jgi:hypothetical protein
VIVNDLDTTEGMSVTALDKKATPAADLDRSAIGTIFDRLASVMPG